MSLTIILGDYGSGKTTAAKYLAKQYDGIYIDIDTIPNIDALAAAVTKGRMYYLDGWPKQYSYKVIQQELKDHIYMAVCLASPDKILERQKKKVVQVGNELPRIISDILRIIYTTVSTALTYDDNPLFIDTTSFPPTLWCKSTWLKHWMQVCLTARFKNAYEYQDVEIDGTPIVGLSRSYKTWERLNSLIDFKSKTVCDYGCNYGYFCFKAEEAGASRVVGIDVSPGIVSLASSIGMTKNSRVIFEIAELKDYQPPDSDIIMALNTLHHLGNDAEVIRVIFQHANIAVFEIPDKDLEIIERLANDNKHSSKVIINSHREGRCIVIYGKHNPIVVPTRYKYKKNRMKSKSLKLIAIRIVHIFTFGHVGLLRRIYLRRFR